MLGAIREGRARKFLKPIAQLRERYEGNRTLDRVSAWQMERFNALWREWKVQVPYFAQLAADRKLAERFGSWEEVQAAFPVMTRSNLQAAGDSLRDTRQKPDYWRTTGGSTAEPVQLPAWDSEREVSARTMWYARSWFSISPADSLFLLWGHSHLLGSGMKGKLRGLIRSVQDRVLGYTRWSAYDLSTAALRRAGDRLLASRPDWMLGYSVALDRFARINRDRTAEFRSLGMKLVVATAEAFPSAESADLIEEVFGCPVAMEYGAVETGVVAHQEPQGGAFRVMWQDHVVECEASEDGEGTGEILVTSLFPRACPLVRYRLGDLITPLPEVDLRLAFARVAGRCNDAVELPGGGLAHSEAFAHVVKDLPEVLGYQVRQERGGKIVFRYLAEDNLAEPTEAEIRRRLSVIDLSLRNIELARANQLEQTVAGKVRTVICESALNAEPGSGPQTLD